MFHRKPQRIYAVVNSIVIKGSRRSSIFFHVPVELRISAGLGSAKVVVRPFRPVARRRFDSTPGSVSCRVARSTRMRYKVSPSGLRPTFHRPPHSRNKTMATAERLAYCWRHVESLPDLERLPLVLDVLSDEEIVASLEAGSASGATTTLRGRWGVR